MMDTGLGSWLKVAQQWGADRSECVAVYKDLTNAYCAKNRHYHDLTHIEHMFSLANQVSGQIEDHDAMYLAIWLHDVIQKLGRDSEQLSADFAAKKLMALGAPVDLVNRVKILILATKHQLNSSINNVISIDEQFISDIDLSILGSTDDIYQAYINECRKEYPVSDFIYKRGRRNFLQGMLERSQIFLSDYFKQRFESTAIANIQSELKVIK